MFLEPQKINEKRGWIEIITGSMFSGKTEELIRRLKRAQFANQSVEIFKPKIDTRYSEDQVVSHNQNEIASTPISSSSELQVLAQGIEVVGIDEAQFFDQELIFVANQLANQGSRVIVAGLDLDFQAQPFGPIPYLIATAEYVTKLHAICVECGSLASRSFRTSGHSKQVQIGEKNNYEPLCRYHYNKKIKEQISAK